MLSGVPSKSDGLWIWTPCLPSFHFTLSYAGPMAIFPPVWWLMGLSAFSSFFLRERNSLGRAAPTCSPSSLCLLGFCRRHSCTSVTIFPNVGTMSYHQGSIHRSSRFPRGSTSLMTAATPFLSLLTGGAAAATWKSHDWTMCRLFRQNPGRPRQQQLGGIIVPWTLRTGPLVVTLYGLQKVVESKS